jgi:hypothetical protein
LVDNDFILAAFNLHAEEKLWGAKVPSLKFATTFFDEVFNALFSASQQNVINEKKKNKKCAILASNENSWFCFTAVKTRL